MRHRFWETFSVLPARDFLLKKLANTEGSPSEAIFVFFHLRIPGYANHEAMLEDVSVCKPFLGTKDMRVAIGIFLLDVSVEVQNIHYLCYCTSVWLVNRISCG